MVSVQRHRVRAVLSSILDGVVVGGAQAAFDHPRRSIARRRAQAGILTAVLVDTLLGELPTLRDIAAGRPPRPADPAEQQLAMAAGLASVGWGLVATVTDRPLGRLLVARGVRRPHLALGIVTGVLAAVSTLPLWWRRARLRIAGDARAAVEAADLAAWEAELSGRVT